MRLPRIALIGCGTVAERYYVPAFRRHPEIVRNLYLVDTNRENAKKIREGLGGGRVSEDLSYVLPEVDGAIILLPNSFHHPVAMECLGAGVHVLCEKPLAELPEQAARLVDTAREKNVFLCVNNTRRIFPAFRAIKEIIDAGSLGRLQEIEYCEGSAFGWPSRTGFYVNPKISSKGILLDLGAHVIDTICWWTGGKPELEDYEDDSYGGPESVVKIRARMDGCTICIVLNRLCELNSAYRIRGRKGQISGKVHEWREFRVRYDTGEEYTKRLTSPARNYPGFVMPVVENFIEVIQGRARPLVSGLDVLDSLTFIHDCYRQRKRFDIPWDREVQIASQDGRKRKRAGKKRKILVTGASGFIGGRTVEMAYLARDGKYPVAAGIRQWSSAARLGRFPVDIVALDLMEKDQIEKALEGVTHIIHCAKGTPEATTEGTRNLLAASLDRGIRHFIHLSTADVYGDAEGIVDESAPLKYTGSPYNRMKIDAERICREYIDKGLPLTIFRPSIVYGPFSSGWSLRFASMALAGELALYEGYGEGLCNLVYVDDLVRALLNTLDCEDSFGKAFNVNGPEITTWNSYFLKLNTMMNLPPLRIIMPEKALLATQLMNPVRAVGSLVKRYFLKPVKKAAESIDVVDAVMRRVEHAARITPPPDELRLYGRNVRYSDDLARNTLPYCPTTGLDEGLGHTIACVRYLGMMPSSTAS